MKPFQNRKCICVRFANRIDAVSAFKNLRGQHPEWLILWVPNHFMDQDPEERNMEALVACKSPSSHESLQPIPYYAYHPHLFYPPTWIHADANAMYYVNGMVPDRRMGRLASVIQNTGVDSMSSLNDDGVVHESTPPNTPNPSSGSSTDIFVGRLNSALITHELIEQKFGAYGTIENIDLIARKSQHSTPPILVLVRTTIY